MSDWRPWLAMHLPYALLRGIFCAYIETQEDVVVLDAMSTDVSSGPLFIFLFYIVPWSIVLLFFLFLMCRLGRHFRCLQWFRDREPTMLDHETDCCDCLTEYERYKRHLEQRGASNEENEDMDDDGAALLRLVYKIKGSPDCCSPHERRYTGVEMRPAAMRSTGGPPARPFPEIIPGGSRRIVDWSAFILVNLMYLFFTWFTGQTRKKYLEKQEEEERLEKERQQHPGKVKRRRKTKQSKSKKKEPEMSTSGSE